MSRWGSAAGRALALLDRAAEGPFDPSTSIAPPQGRRRSWVHYGVMMPGLPAPHRFFNVMAVLGTPGAAFVANDHLITTSPRDTAYVVSATSAMTGGQFRAYRMQDECAFAADGSSLRFGADLAIEGGLPGFHVRRTHPEAAVDLEIWPTDVVTRFIRLPGVYDHWSLLCEAGGTVGGVAVDGLCTVEYACGVGLHSLLDRRLSRRLQLPVTFFTYHVLNLDDRTQLLFTYVRGPGEMPLQQAVHVRSLDDGATTIRDGVSFTVDSSEPRTTPDGRTMRLPLQFHWTAEGVRVTGTSHRDFTYGLGAGFVGTYDYEGTVHGRPISGCAYIEYVDCR